MTMSAATALLPRQEAFCRHLASGRSLAGAARLAGYAWGSARQHGSALMRHPRVAARVVELSAAREARRQEELAWVVARAKRAVESALAKGQEGTVLRGLDRVVGFQRLMDVAADRVSDLDLADPAPDLDGAEATGAGAADAPPAMPPERAAPVEPSPDPRVAADEAHAAYVARLRAQAEANAAALRARLAAQRHRADPSEPEGPEAADEAGLPPAMPPERPASVEPSPDPRVAAEAAHADYVARLLVVARARIAARRAEYAPDDAPTGPCVDADGHEGPRLEADREGEGRDRVSPADEAAFHDLL
jgi:phage terminase small subunit